MDDELVVAVARRAEFHVGYYSDGSGPAVKVHYDLDGKSTADCIWVETGSNNWLAFAVDHAEELIAAIRAAAAAIRKAGEAQ